MYNTTPLLCSDFIWALYVKAFYPRMKKRAWLVWVMLSVCQGVSIIFYLCSLPLLMGKDSHYDNGGRVIYLVLIWNDSPLCQLSPQPHLHPLLMQWEDDNGKHRQRKDVKAKKYRVTKATLVPCSIFIFIFFNLNYLHVCIKWSSISWLICIKNHVKCF